MRQFFIKLNLIILLITLTSPSLIKENTSEVNATIEIVETNEWKLVANNVEATVYNAIPEQCWGDYTYTASMFKINVNDVFSHKIIAMERTFMKKLGLEYGDVVKIEGTNKLDGIWQIQDTMSKKYAGRKKIDFLVPNNIKTGKWKNVKIYCLTDKSNTYIYKNNMAPQLNTKI